MVLSCHCSSFPLLMFKDFGKFEKERSLQSTNDLCLARKGNSTGVEAGEKAGEATLC